VLARLIFAIHVMRLPVAKFCLAVKAAQEMTSNVICWGTF